MSDLQPFENIDASSELLRRYGELSSYFSQVFNSIIFEKKDNLFKQLILEHIKIYEEVASLF